MVKRTYFRLLTGAMGLLMGLMVFTGGQTAAAETTEGRTLKVAFSDLEGISERDAYGRHTGLMMDYLNEIAKYTGWEYEYIEDTSEDIVTHFLEGKYDLMGGTFYSPGFEEFFAYPEYSMGRSRGVLLCRMEDDRLLGYDLSTLDGKTIGVYEKATEKIRYLNEFLASNNIQCELRYYTNEDMGEAGNLYRQLRDGEVDMLLGNDLEIGGEFRMVSSFPAQPYYIVTTVGNTEILDGLNMALQYILESTPDFAEEAYNSNFPDVKFVDIQLNDRELAYIRQKEQIIVAVPKKWHPINCTGNPLDHHEGMLPDLLEKISAFSGLEFTCVYGDNYMDSVRLVKEGKADILGGYLGSEEQAFSSGMVLSQTYVELDNIVLKNKSVNYPGEDLTGGVLDGQKLPADFQAEEVRSYDTLREMVKAVNDGEVDYIYGVSAMLEREMQRHRYLNVVPVTQTGSSTDVSFAMTRPVTPELLTVLNKAIGDISSAERTALLNQNLVSMGYSSLSFQDMIYANPVAFLLIFGGVLLLATAVILLVIRGNMKDSLMQSRLEAAEAKSLAKSEFLSHMSHEIRTPMNAIVGLSSLACMEPNIPEAVEKKLIKIRSSSQYLLSLINDILDMSRIENRKMEIEERNFSLGDMVEELQGMMSVQAEQKGLTFQSVCRFEHSWLVGDPIRLRQILTNLLSNAIKFTYAGGTVVLWVEETDCDGETAGYEFCVQDSGVGIPPEEQERIFGAFEQLNPSVSSSAGTGLGLPISRSIAQLMGGDIRLKSKPGEGSEFSVSLRFPLGEEMAPETPEMAGEKRSLDGMKILLAEDNDINAEIAQELLALRGVKVSRAANGRETVELFAASEVGEYQAILMDIQMPVMDGHEAAREIRESGRPDAAVPIIAMTANSFKEDEEAAREAGMDGFVPKPVEPEYLFSVLERLL